MNDQVELMITADSGCLQIHQAIARAGSAAELRRIAREDILQAGEISEHERRGLQAAVNRRFSALNAAALKGASKPRWG